MGWGGGPLDGGFGREQTLNDQAANTTVAAPAPATSMRRGRCAMVRMSSLVSSVS